MRRVMFTALVACLCLLLSPLAAQDQFERQVRKQLAEVGGALADKGYAMTHRVFVGRLNDGQTETVTFKLERGVNYAVVGVCDQDCSDLDLHVTDPTERELGRDVSDDDVPVVEFQAAQAGDYDVKVDMAKCADNPCSYGIGIFATNLDPFEKQVRTQLQQAAQKLGQQGLELTHTIHIGMLKQGEAEDVPVDLVGGARYVVVGVCDNDCKDLDLALRDRSGREVDRDVERDDYPMVAVQPSRDERYSVRALMAQCGSNPCRYGFGVFSK